MIIHETTPHILQYYRPGDTLTAPQKNEIAKTAPWAFWYSHHPIGMYFYGFSGDINACILDEENANVLHLFRQSKASHFEYLELTPEKIEKARSLYKNDRAASDFIYQEWVKMFPSEKFMHHKIGDRSLLIAISEQGDDFLDFFFYNNDSVTLGEEHV